MYKLCIGFVEVSVVFCDFKKIVGIFCERYYVYLFLFMCFLNVLLE